MKGYKPVFSDKEKLQEALCLLERGKLTYTEVAEMFKCHHSTLVYHARRHGVAPRLPIRKSPGGPSKYQKMLKVWEEKKEGEKPKPPMTAKEFKEAFWKGINRGKMTYKAYLEEEKRRLSTPKKL